MVSINYATREVSCKIVYYGPGLSGKTTNLQYVHQKVPSETKGKLISLATDADRTLYFDFLPINIGSINGFQAKFQLYTVPGQVYYNATRKLVLRGVDGLVFVADSQPDKMDENVESLNNLRENLAEYGYKIDELPIVIQYNKQDLPNIMTPEEMRPQLNSNNWPEFKASATEGFGVFDTLKYMLKLVLDHARKGGTVPSSKPAAAPPPAQSKAEPVHAAAQPVPVKTEPVVSAEPTAVRPAAESPAPVQPYREEAVPDPEEESVSEPIEPVAEGSAYRPFPGNSWEDEQSAVPATDIPEVSIPVSQELEPEFSETNTKPSTTPRMSPSLRAYEKPKKKRSFFKRLFGLK